MGTVYAEYFTSEGKRVVIGVPFDGDLDDAAVSPTVIAEIDKQLPEDATDLNWPIILSGWDAVKAICGL